MVRRARGSPGADDRLRPYSPLPVLIRQPPPFGLASDALRRSLLRYQGETRLDRMGTDLETLWSRAGPVPAEAPRVSFRHSLVLLVNIAE